VLEPSGRDTTTEPITNRITTVLRLRHWEKKKTRQYAYTMAVRFAEYETHQNVSFSQLHGLIRWCYPEFGVGFCSGGALFFLFGLILFFDRPLLAMGNILFLIGITLLLGPQRTFLFFARRNKWRGSAAFWAG